MSQPQTPPPNGQAALSAGLSSAVDRLSEVAAAYDVSPEYTSSAVQPVAPTAPAQKPPAAPAAPASPPAPAAPAAPAAAAAHPKWLTDRASDLGLHPLMVERLDTASLQQVVIESLAAQRSAAQAEARSALTNPPPQTVEQSEAQAQARGVEFDWGEHEDYDVHGRPTGKKRKYTDDDTAPHLAAAIKRMAAELEQVKAFNQQMVAQMRGSQERTVEQQFDSVFSEMPGVFGTGTGAALKGRPEFERRAAVFNAVRNMLRGLPREAAAKADIRSAVLLMSKTLFGVEPAAPAAAATPKPEAAALPASHPGHAFASGGVAQPTDRSTQQQPKGEARARQAVADWWAQQEPAASGDDDVFVP